MLLQVVRLPLVREADGLYAVPADLSIALRSCLLRCLRMRPQLSTVSTLPRPCECMSYVCSNRTSLSDMEHPAYLLRCKCHETEVLPSVQRSILGKVAIHHLRYARRDYQFSCTVE